MEAYRIKSKREADEWMEKTNFAGWLNGVYIARAIGANFAKGTSYYDKPIDFKGEADAEKENQANVAKFEAWATMFNHLKKYGKEVAADEDGHTGTNHRIEK